MAGFSFNSNVLSLFAQRGLTAAANQVSQSFQRLSSGLRINSASDDAAGLAIADQLRVNTRLSNQAVRNINDGISTVNIVTGTLQNQSQILQRLSELAEQSANGTLSDAQRTSISTEYQQLVNEYGRLGDTTTFNGVKLLNGGKGSNPSSIQLQTGIDGSSNSSLSLNAANTGAFSGTIQYVPSSGAVLASFNSISLSTILANASNRVTHINITDSKGASHDALLAMNDGTGDFVNSNGVGFNLFIKDSEAPSAGINNPGEYTVVGLSSNAVIYFDPTTGKVTGNSTIGTTNTTSLANGASFSLSIDMSGLIGSATASTDGNVSALDFTGVETSTRAKNALDFLKTKQDEISGIIGTYGAAESRLNIESSVLKTMSENFSAAESRIRDVDVATESAALVAAQIREQVATQMLGLANSQPKLLLSLLTN